MLRGNIPTHQGHLSSGDDTLLLDPFALQISFSAAASAFAGPGLRLTRGKALGLRV